MKIVGKILWWDKKDQNGIIIDANGREFYFDISVLENRKSNPAAGAIVQFEKNDSLKQIACAKAVCLPPRKNKNRLEREFEKNLQLTFQL